MKDKDIKKKLLDSLDGLPSPAPYVSRAPLPQPQKPAPKKKFAFRPIIAYGMAAIILISVLLPVLAVSGVFRPKQTVSASVAIIDVNPSVVLIADKQDVVTAVTANNEDADLLLYDPAFRAQLIGLPLADGAILVAERALALGYFKETDNAMRVSVLNDLDSHADALLGGLRESLVGYFAGEGIYTAIGTQKLSASNFVDSVNASANTIAQIYTQMPPLDLDREQVTDEQAESAYLARFRAYVCDLAITIYRVVSGKKADLSLIGTQNDVILSHEENPGFLLKDYWTLVDSNKTFTPAFATQMEEMTKLLTSFESNYGQSLDGLGFSLLHAFYSSLDLEEVYADCLEIINTVFDFAEIFNPQALLVKMASGDENLSQMITGFCDEVAAVPENALDYTEQARLLLQKEAESRAYAATRFCSANRQPISLQDYAAWEQSKLG